MQPHRRSGFAEFPFSRTGLALLMFPVLVAMYVWLARREEREALAAFGDAYAHYAARVPAFVPRLRRAMKEAPRN